MTDPIHVAQAVVSIDRLSNHRFLLGLVSGDRKNEFKAFGRDWNERSEIFREGWDLTKKSLTHPNRLHFSGNYYSKLTGSLSFVPQLEEGYSMPLVAIGRCRQDLSWLANEPDAWIWHEIGEDETAPAVKKLNDLNEDGNWHPFGYQNFVLSCWMTRTPHASSSTRSTCAGAPRAWPSSGASSARKA